MRVAHDTNHVERSGPLHDGVRVDDVVKTVIAALSLTPNQSATLSAAFW
jgi:hypothetical protein